MRTMPEVLSTNVSLLLNPAGSHSQRGASMFGPAHGSVLLAHTKIHSAMARHD